MDATTKTKLLELAGKLKDRDPGMLDSVIGFDGFVDEVVHVVDKRIDPKNYTRVLTLTEYGQRIAATSGLSSNVEIVTISKKLGGNGPILANALIQSGVKMTYIGAVGYPDVNAVFLDMASRCERVIPVCEPASTDAMEFEDGKIIRSKLSPFQDLNFETIRQRVGLAELAALLEGSDLIGFENWALPPYSGQIWQGIYEQVLPLMKSDTQSKTLFFDLADPASRRESELKSALETISAFSMHFNVILGLNLREAVQVANLFDGNFDTADCDMEALIRYIRDYVKVKTLVIHPVKESCCLVDGRFYHGTGPFCAKPKLTTGAGDNFNAGFVLGISLGLEPQEALLLGMASSGFYVRQSRSGSFEELKNFLGLWANNEID
jgi:hypothetical protein